MDYQSWSLGCYYSWYGAACANLHVSLKLTSTVLLEPQWQWLLKKNFSEPLGSGKIQPHFIITHIFMSVMEIVYQLPEDLVTAQDCLPAIIKCFVCPEPAQFHAVSGKPPARALRSFYLRNGAHCLVPKDCLVSSVHFILCLHGMAYTLLLFFPLTPFLDHKGSSTALPSSDPHTRQLLHNIMLSPLSLIS